MTNHADGPRSRLQRHPIRCPIYVVTSAEFCGFLRVTVTIKFFGH